MALVSLASSSRSPRFLPSAFSPPPRIRSPPRIPLARWSLPVASPPASLSPSPPRSASPARRRVPSASASASPRFRKIKGGRQADIYVDEARGVLQKEFKTRPAANVAEQAAFLRDNALSGHVPRLYSADPEQGVLVMQYLEGYEQLKRALPQLKRRGRAVLEDLLRALNAARRRLRTDQWYADLSNLTNILVKEDASAPFGFDIQFVEGGAAQPITPEQQETYVNLFLKEVIRDGKLLGVPLAKRIRQDQPWQ